VRRSKQVEDRLHRVECLWRNLDEQSVPARHGARVKSLERLQYEPRTMVFFESSHRIRESVADLAAVFGEDRPVAVCREMTKQFETVLRGPLAAVGDRIAGDPDQEKGEFVLVIAGASEQADARLADAVVLAKSLLEHLPASKAARVAARLHEVSRREVYSALPYDSDPG